MPLHNSDIADKLNQTADLLEIQGDNPFRIRAYRNAARTVLSLSQPVAELIDQDGDLTRYPGIGKDLGGKIRQLVQTGRLDVLAELEKQIPGELSQLMDIAGLGAKRVARIFHELQISNLDQLKAAAMSGRLRDLEGFGEKTEQKLLEDIARLQQEKNQRTPLAVAEEIAHALVEHLKTGRGIKQIDVAGSYRRRKETVKDLDILVTCKSGSNVMDRFTQYEDVQKIVSQGTTRSTVLLRSDFQVDLRVVPQVCYGAALNYFTGSKEHNIAIRKMAVQRKFKLNEYGIFEGDTRIGGKTEAEVYRALDLPYIEPELREDRGEIQAAQAGGLPHLIERKHIRGDLHAHTKYTDGRHSIEEMARAARDLGYEYLAITDHSQHVTVAGGLKPRDVKKQLKEIDRVNETLEGITLLKGTEVDILEDGRLDLPDALLGELDLRVCSVHYKFNLSQQKQTERIIRAMDNPHFNILAHPSGRLINERDPYDVDMERIIKAARERGCLLELNAHPDRLDLNDIYCKLAKDVGAKVVISTDAHQLGHLHYMRFGIGQARRGWLEPQDVANTRTLKQLRKILQRGS